jgi:hypothetical protein
MPWACAASTISRSTCPPPKRGDRRSAASRVPVGPVSPVEFHGLAPGLFRGAHRMRTAPKGEVWLGPSVDPRPVTGRERATVEPRWLRRAPPQEPARSTDGRPSPPVPTAPLDVAEPALALLTLDRAKGLAQRRCVAKITTPTSGRGTLVSGAVVPSRHHDEHRAFPGASRTPPLSMGDPLGHRHHRPHRLWAERRFGR